MDDFGDITEMLDCIGYDITLEREVRTEGNAVEGDTVTWRTLTIAKGSIQNLSGNEVLKAKKEGIEATDILYVRSKDVTEKSEGDWILKDGFWNDNGVWDDNAVWLSEYLDSIKEKDRVLWRNKYFEITYIDDVVGINKYMKVFLKYSDDYTQESFNR